MEIDMTTDARLISPALISQANVAGVEEKQQPHEENSTAHEKKIKYGYDELKWNNAKPLYIGNLGVPHVYETSSIEDESLEVVDQEPLKEEEMMHRIPIHAEKTALLIVDVQPEYWSACPSVRKDFPNFEKSFALTLKIARERKCKIIWVRADYRRESSPWLKQFERLSRGNKKRKDTKVELPCDPDDKEFGWEPFATPEGRESIITKTSWSSTSNTALMDILASSGIDTVLVCGLITSVCVQHSAFGVFEAGYRTLLVEDSCGDRGRARHEAALALYGGYMYELITSVDLADSETGLQMAKPIWITKRKSNIVESSSVISRNSSAASLVMTGSSHSTISEESEGCKVTDSNKKRKVSFPEHDYYP